MTARLKQVDGYGSKYLNSVVHKPKIHIKFTKPKQDLLQKKITKPQKEIQRQEMKKQELQNNNLKLRNKVAIGTRLLTIIFNVK